jgi:hypothetical protein
MNPLHSISIYRLNAIEAAITAKGMTSKEVCVVVHLNRRSTQKYLSYLINEKRAYVEDWRPNRSTLAQVYRLGNQPSMPKPAPATRTQHHKTYRAKLVKDPARNDLHLAKRRARDWAKAAAKRPSTWVSALFVGVRAGSMNAEG